MPTNDDSSSRCSTMRRLRIVSLGDSICVVIQHGDRFTMSISVVVSWSLYETQSVTSTSSICIVKRHDTATSRRRETNSVS